MPKERPAVLIGKTTRYQTECGNLFLTINRNEQGEIIEIQPVMGKSGHCQRSLLEFIGTLLSIYLQTEIPDEERIKTLKRHGEDINCGQSFKIGEHKYTSCLDLISDALITELRESKKK